MHRRALFEKCLLDGIVPELFLVGTIYDRTRIGLAR